MTRTLAARSVQASAIAAGFLLLAGGAAQADGTDATSAGNNGIANGNQAIVPVQAPINVCGNGIAVAGVSGAGCQGGSTATLEAGGDMVAAGNNGIANGNQVSVPVQVPINVCGNSVGALVGVAGAGCDGGSSASSESAGAAEATAPDGASAVADPNMTSAGNDGILNGNQIYLPVQAPIDVCGNSVGALVGVAGAGCQGGSGASNGSEMSQGSMTTPATQESVSDVAGQVLPGGAMLPPSQAGDSVTSSLPAGDVLGDVTGQAAGKPSSGSVMTKPEDGGVGLPTDQLTQQLPTDDAVGLNNQPAQEDGPGQMGLPTDGILGGLPAGDLLGGLNGGGQGMQQPAQQGAQSQSSTGGAAASQEDGIGLPTDQLTQQLPTDGLTGSNSQQVPAEDGGLGLPTDQLTKQLPTDGVAGSNNQQAPADGSGAQDQQAPADGGNVADDQQVPAEDGATDATDKVSGSVADVSQQLPTDKLVNVQKNSGSDSSMAPAA